MKAEIDKYITENYQALIRRAQSYITYFERAITAEDLVHYAYMEVVKRPPKTKEEIESFIVAFMRQETRFTQSKTNRKHRSNSIEVNDVEDVCNDVLCVDSNIDFMLMYENFTKDFTRQEKIICYVYFMQGKQTAKDLAKHFNINYNTFQKETKPLIDKINKFKDEVKRKI